MLDVLEWKVQSNLGHIPEAQLQLIDVLLCRDLVSCSCVLGTHETIHQPAHGANSKIRLGADTPQRDFNPGLSNIKCVHIDMFDEQAYRVLHYLLYVIHKSANTICVTTTR